MDCCATKNNSRKGLLNGLLFGLIPHSFCILFIILSILGATIGTALLKNVLIIPYFFQILIALSFIFATISALIYLKRMGQLSFSGIKLKWRYLTVLYSTTLIINFFLFFIAFPAVANMNSSKEIGSASIVINVDIPCSGHAPLIISELGKENGIKNISFNLPNIFNVSYDPNIITKEKILSLQIFKSFKAYSAI